MIISKINKQTNKKALLLLLLLYFQTLASITILFYFLGVSAFCGFAVCVAILPVWVITSRGVSVFQKRALVSIKLVFCVDIFRTGCKTIG